MSIKSRKALVDRLDAFSAEFVALAKKHGLSCVYGVEADDGRSRSISFGGFGPPQTLAVVGAQTYAWSRENLERELARMIDETRAQTRRGAK